MESRPRLHLIVREGGRKELGRQMIRAMIEFRSADARALADRIAKRGKLQLASVEDNGPDSTNVGGEHHDP